MTRETTFGELVRAATLHIGDGYRAKNEELGGGGLVFLRAAYLQDAGFNLGEPDRFLTSEERKFGPKIAQIGDVVITTKGNSTGRVGRIREGQVGAVYSPHLSYWRSRDRNQIDQGFIFYWSQSADFRSQLSGMAGSTDMAPYLSLRDQLRLRISLPRIDDQRAIAAILGALDDKIEINRRMNETLEAMERAIFKDWFVDFGPTRAKMEGRAPYLAPDLWALFPDRLDDDGKPEGWQNGKLADIADITMGASPDGSTYNDQAIGTPLVNGPVEYGDFFLRRVKWTTAPNKLSCKGDLILCVRGSTTGRHAFADGEYCLGRGVCSIRGILDQQEFADACVLGHLDRLLQRTTGSVFPNLSSDDIRNFEILIPTEAVRKSYCEVVRPLRAQIWANVEQIEILTATRDLLLPKLMSGEIRVKDAEKMLEAAS